MLNDNNCKDESILSVGSHCALLPKCESESNVQSGLSQHNARDEMSAEHRLGKLKDKLPCQTSHVSQTWLHSSMWQTMTWTWTLVGALMPQCGFCPSQVIWKGYQWPYKFFFFNYHITEVSWSLVTMKPVKPVSLSRKAINHLRDARNSEHLTWCLTYDLDDDTAFIKIIASYTPINQLIIFFSSFSCPFAATIQVSWYDMCSNKLP